VAVRFPASGATIPAAVMASVAVKPRGIWLVKESFGLTVG
jgi:hypothetical protein